MRPTDDTRHAPLAEELLREAAREDVAVIRLLELTGVGYYVRADEDGLRLIALRADAGMEILARGLRRHHEAADLGGSWVLPLDEEIPASTYR